jgi:hypothetical protein
MLTASRLCREMRAGNRGNGFAGKDLPSGLDRRPWRESGHRRDAYDTLDSVTCLPPRPDQKYHRRPVCAAR